MKILGIETATAVCSVALVETGGTTIERSINSRQMHSERILFLIDECLTEGKCDPGSIDGIAVSIGPGSFTGLRIGLSVAKGLAYSAKLPICGVPTLMALARQASASPESVDDCVILPMIDARRDEVYCAAYRFNNGDLTEIQPSRAARLDEIPSLSKSGQKIVIIGDGAGKFKEYFKKTAFNKSNYYIFPSGPFVNCSAIPVAEIGTSRIMAGAADRVADLEPLYVKEFYTTAGTVK